METVEDEAVSKRRLADRKVVRDLADFAFRVVQMWIVLALVVYMQRETQSDFATIVMFGLVIALFLYTMNSPMVLIEEWANSRGKQPHGLVWIGALLAIGVIMAPLLFSDPILNEMNRIAHAKPVETGLH